MRFEEIHYAMISVFLQISHLLIELNYILFYFTFFFFLILYELDLNRIKLDLIGLDANNTFKKK